MVLYFISCHKWKNLNYRSSVLTIAASTGLVLLSTMMLVRAGILSTFFGNLNYAYTDYGFPYCFINTSVNKGIARPDNYSETEIESLLKKHTTNGTDQILKNEKSSPAHPNIIVLQMESFTCAKDYNNIKVSKDPTPVFTDLMKNYSSGTFEVPACGAGTANTEFEVLTGISARFFGPGEYPYKGRLRTRALESLPYVLKSQGYSTSAMHNHRALFYNRNEVYANLGFDNYTSLEYMNNIKKTPTGWCKDAVMTDDIMDIMKRTPGRDFLHVISVEGHGAYPTEQVFKKPYTRVTAQDEETRWKYEYYLNECYEMDKFVGDTIKRIKESGEPTVVLVYGDHIPALDIKSKDYSKGNLYKTRYAIWDNIGLAKEDENIKAYEVSAKILERIGLAHRGTIFDYQQTTERSNPDYKKNLKALSYDMLYGDNFIFGGINPFKRSSMTMGYKKIKIKDIVQIDNDYYIKGENFTEHSSISLDGKILKTIYLSPTLLGLQQKVEPEDVSRLQVSQVDTKDDTVLSTINSLEEL